MGIDSHHHFWRVARGDYGWLTADSFPVLYRDYLPGDLAPLLKQCGIDKTILVQGAQTIAETEFLLEIADATAFVAGVVGWVDFEAANAAEDIARLARRKKLVSLRPMLQDLEDDAWILRPGIAPAIEALRKSGLRFDALVFPRHLPHLIHFLERHADLAAVIDHGAKPYIARGEIEPWATQMRHIAKTTDATCKLSGLATEAGDNWSAEKLKPYVDVLLDAFGASRLMWGSDWPVLNLAGDYVRWFGAAEELTAPLSAGERERIFGGTAADFYGVG